MAKVLSPTMATLFLNETTSKIPGIFFTSSAENDFNVAPKGGRTICAKTIPGLRMSIPNKGLPVTTFLLSTPFTRVPIIL